MVASDFRKRAGASGRQNFPLRLHHNKPIPLWVKSPINSPDLLVRLIELELGFPLPTKMKTLPLLYWCRSAQRIKLQLQRGRPVEGYTGAPIPSTGLPHAEGNTGKFPRLSATQNPK